MSGSVEHLATLTGFDDAAKIHHGDAVGDVAHHRKIVGDEQVGQAKLLLQIFQEVDDLCLDGDVEGGNGLVEDEQIRTQRQRAGDGDALSLAAGELTRPPLGALRIDTDLAQQLGDAPGIVDAIDPQRLRDDLRNRHPRIERRIGVLEHDLQLAPHGAKLAGRQRLEIAAFEHDRARGRRVQAEDDAAKGRLAAS